MVGNSSSPNSTSANIKLSGIDLYFLESDGSTFKSTVLCDLYFYIIARQSQSRQHAMSWNQTCEDEEEDSMFLSWCKTPTVLLFLKHKSDFSRVE